jgi:zinc and cadmium transporter
VSTLLWIVISGLAMSAIALVGSVSLLLPGRVLGHVLLPLVAFAAGTLLGGAFLHMLPAAIEQSGPRLSVFLWLLAGFTSFFVLEQFLHWRHQHRADDPRSPLTYLILIGDGLHNFLGGLAVGGAFVVDLRLGLSAWLAAAAHEIPQEIGDFGVLVHGGWSKRKALLFNVISALTFLLGGMVAWAVSRQIDVSFLLPFAAGNFIYIAASDLIPEVRKPSPLPIGILHLTALLLGLGLLYILRILLDT